MPRFRLAAAKLNALFSENPGAGWADKVRHVSPAQPMLSPTITAGVLDAVQTALLHERQLEVRYRFAEVYRGLLLRLHPLGLVQRGPVTYLVATAFAYTDVRL